jgi:hypothetical protein
MRFRVVCPVCRETLEFEQKGEISYGVINLEDFACAEVTMSWDAEVAEHLNEHRRDGSHMAKLEERWKYEQERAERFFARKAKETV